MRTKDNNRLKTLGPRAARLVATLHERGRPLFTLKDAAAASGLGMASARSLLRKLVHRGVATRLRPGLFILVPFELGRAREYLGNPFVVARELAGGRPHYLSHASAMDIHGMTTQPQLIVFVTSPRSIRRCTVLGTEFRFVRCKERDLFGTVERPVDRKDKVVTSDLERTVLDGLKQPEHCGGVTEVARGLWMRRSDMDPERIVDYALRLDVGAVVRRLGFLMETYGIGDSGVRDRLRRRLTATYSPLDPILPAEGKLLRRWRLRLNVLPEELQAVVGT
ncbi:MAG: type IV toxin-antitoxin system AbiEi family antitoxin domain-containing protein [Planctomycetes bacterium]|nr:type IV toxin-antitoxin system AbiEi family antitoxin domain-containing protein [Planctomycetota bacterium]